MVALYPLPRSGHGAIAVKHGICASGAVHLLSLNSVRLASDTTNPTTTTCDGPPTVRGGSLCDACLCPGFGLDRGPSPLVPMTSAVALLAVVFLLALLVWANARARLLKIGILDGRIVYQDTDRRRNVERPLVSHRVWSQWETGLPRGPIQ